MNLSDSIALSVNVPAKIEIDGKTIVGIFESGELPQEWQGHIGGIFLECGIKKFFAFMEAYGISLQDVKKVYEKTPIFYHTNGMEEFLNGKMGGVNAMTENSKKAIDAIADIISQTVPCKQIYLFGSYAYGTPHKDSDYDFYVVIPDEGVRPLMATSRIYRALYKKTEKKPVDILVKRFSDFQNRKDALTLEREIFNKGVVLYEA